jgi:hypothetical protein
MMLLRLTLLHKATTTKVFALFPFLSLTFLLLCVFGRMRTMAKLLIVSCCLHNVRSQSTSCKRGHCMSRCCEIRLLTACEYSCVMCTCLITPNQCPCLMRPLPCIAICRNTTTRRVASNHVSLSPLQSQCRARWAVHGRQVAEVSIAPRKQSLRLTMLPSFINSSGSPTTLSSLLLQTCHCESAVFYQRAINATRPCELNSWIQLFSSHGLVAFIARW